MIKEIQMTKLLPQRPTVAEFLADKIAAIDKTQRQISEECGFDNPNIITMFKNGLTKLPINRITPLAKALDVDPAYLLRLVMHEYMPDAWEAIENIMQSTVLTSNELNLVRAYREVTGDNDAAAVVIDRSAVLAIVTA
jgi:transcriptional regulator with XRE-family HTH domain